MRETCSSFLILCVQSFLLYDWIHFFQLGWLLQENKKIKILVLNWYSRIQLEVTLNFNPITFPKMKIKFGIYFWGFKFGASDWKSVLFSTHVSILLSLVVRLASCLVIISPFFRDWSPIADPYPPFWSFETHQNNFSKQIVWLAAPGSLTALLTPEPIFSI